MRDNIEEVFGALHNELPRGIAFARAALCLAATKGDLSRAQGLAARYDASRGASVERSIHNAITKAAVGVGGLGSWGSPLGLDNRLMAGEFVEIVSLFSVVGRIKGFTRVPFRTPLLVAGDFGAAIFVAEGAPTPVTAEVFTRQSMDVAKISSIAIITDELAKLSSLSAEQLLLKMLTNATVRGLDNVFLDPSHAAVAGESPGSVTHDGTQVTATGVSASAVESDLDGMVQRLIDAGSGLAEAVWILNPKTALYLARLRGSGGERIFPNIGAFGGDLFGIPAITSKSVALAGSPTDSFIVLLDAAKVMVADDGIVTLEISTDASVQMSDSPAAGANTLVSLWQNNLIGILTRRYVNWKLVDADFCQVLMDVQY